MPLLRFDLFPFISGAHPAFNTFYFFQRDLFKSSFLAFFVYPYSFAVLVARKRSRLFSRLPRPDALDCDEFSTDSSLCNAENTRFPLKFEVSGQNVSELAVSSSKIFFTSSDASTRQDDNYERDE